MMLKEQQTYAVNALKKLAHELDRVPMVSDFIIRLPNLDINGLFGSYDGLLKAAGLHILSNESDPKPKLREPRIGVFDIETKPLKVYTFKIFDANIPTEAIIEDWSVLSWAFKWVGNDTIFYQDLSQNKDYTDDELIVRGIWELFDQADIIIGQNSDSFDIKRLQAKFEEYELGQPSPYKSVDTLKIMRRHLGLTSKKLAFATDKYNKKYKKLKHEKFAGLSLWLECLNGNQEAWACMKEYNCYDVLATEELYLDHLRKWDKSINFGVFTGVSHSCPNCGNTELTEKEYSYTKTGVFQNYQCNNCKSFSMSKQNELSTKTKKNLLK